MTNPSMLYQCFALTIVFVCILWIYASKVLHVQPESMIAAPVDSPDPGFD